MKKFLYIGLFTSLLTPCLAIGPSLSLAAPLKKILAPNGACRAFLASPVASPEITSFHDLVTAFTGGLEPDLSRKDHRAAFHLYRVLRFGNPNTVLHDISTQSILTALQRYPRLRERTHFSSYHVRPQGLRYPVSSELSQFINSQLKSVGQVKNNLFQIEANIGYWRKMLGHQEIPSMLRLRVVKKKLPTKKRATRIYEFMSEQRARMLKEGHNVENISQSMVDLIHSIGHLDNVLKKELKSNDSVEVLRAFKETLKARDDFAVELGFEGQFAQVLTDLGVAHPTGLTEQGGKLASLLKSFEGKAVEIDPALKSDQERTIRHLSLVESPFRSCLGNDCSSRSYFSKALDPNYHYFTLTNGEGYSSGHVTIVLGEAQKNDQTTKVAFVDKVQNVDNVDIPIMLEGIRMSVKEEGYLLALPKYMGNHNGISNKKITREFIAKRIPTGKKVFRNFAPHPHSFDIRAGFSRATENLGLYEVLPFKSDRASITRSGIAPPPENLKINMKKIVGNYIDLKRGSTEDRIRYIESMKTLEKVKVKTDPQFNRTLSRWLKDSKSDFRLRKYIFIHKLNETKSYEKRRTHEMFSNIHLYFSKEESISLIQNLWSTPKYKHWILTNKGGATDLIFFLRHSSPKLARLILAGSMPHFSYKDKVLHAFENYLSGQEAIDDSVMGMLVHLGLSAADYPKERSLIEMLFSTFDNSLQDKVSQVIQFAQERQNPFFLNVLARWTFKRYGPQLKEEISQAIEVAFKMNTPSFVDSLARYTFPLHKVALKEQIFHAGQVALKMKIKNIARKSPRLRKLFPDQLSH